MGLRSQVQRMKSYVLCVCDKLVDKLAVVAIDKLAFVAMNKLAFVAINKLAFVAIDKLALENVPAKIMSMRRYDHAHGDWHL